MVQTLNFINLSSQQAPNDVDWAGLVNSGVQGVLIRLGHGIIRDPCASGHIAKAKQYGLYWHGYHTYEGVVNEPQFTIKNATELGLSTSQYYFVDLTKSSDPFNDYYALHATWLSQGYSTGLLISNDDYLSKFTDSEVTASGTLRWLISDTEPADYDVWQYSSEGTVGTSSAKVGLNFAKTDKLKYNLNTTLTGADISKDPYNPQTPVGGAYIGWGYDTTGLGGGKTIGYSTNGKNFYALIGPNGLVVRKSDGNRIYGTIADQIDSAISANVIPAKSAADSAVAYANDAVEKSRVNSQAIEDINSAVSDAASDAAVARSDGLRAWNAAQSNVNLIDLNYASASAAISSVRTEAIAAADEAKTSASAAQADIVAVRSDVAAVQADVTATQSDVAVAKSAIADTKSSLTSQAKSLSSYAAQASAAGNDITTLKSQAGQFEQDMASVKGDVSQLKVSASSASVALLDATGNISNLQATAKSFSAALSDTNSNVAGVTATARELETKYADAAGDISHIKTDAKGMTQTISDAQGDIAKLKTRADGFDAEFATANGNISKLQTDATGTTQTLANAKSDIAVLQSRADGFDAKYATAAGDINTLKTNASGFSQTLTNAQGDISTLKSTVSGVQTTLTDAQGNISTLQSDVSGLKKTTSDNAGNIATLQASAQTLTNQMSGAQGDISTLKQTASDFSSKVSGMETSLSDANSKINGIQANGGGRNLVANTGTDIVIDATSPNAGNWASTKIYFTEQLKQGDLITISADSTLTGTGTLDEYRVNLFDAKTTQSRSTAQYLEAGKRDSVTLSLDNLNGSGDTVLLIYAGKGGDTQGKKNVIHHLMVEKGTVAHDWSPAPEDTDAKITANTTAIGQNKQAIALKADQTTVDKTNGTVQQLQSQLQVQAGQIATKVSSSDLDARNYATQTYTQTQIKQTADSWNANLASVKDGLTQSYTNLSATVDGIKSTVATKADQSTVTQLSNALQSKVESSTYTSAINQLSNDINLRVKSADLISQINLQAGATLIQSNKLVLDARTTVFTGDAFIPDAYISTLNADKLMFYGSDGTSATMGASVAQYDDDKTKSTINLQYSGGIEIHSSDQQGSILTMHDNTIRLASKTWGDNSNPYQYSGFYAAPNYSLMNTYHKDGTTSGVAIDDNRIWIYGDSKDQQLGALQADVGWYSINGKTGLLTGNQIALKSGNTQATLTDNNINIENTNDTNIKNYDVAIHIKGWAEMTGWFTCMGLTQTSLLSTKTRIEPLDTAKALELINSADVATYQYKQEVAHGGTKRHASVIIDDVNDVARYQTPDEIISEDRQGRNDGDIVGYLMGAVQELTKKLKTLESKVG
ncbi:hypothetical protein HCY78_07320 [Limosilactobacillus fermentum]